jgi:hypothetical protein
MTLPMPSQHDLRGRPMTHEYGESINAEVVETAVVTTLKLRKEAPGVPLNVHVDQAIHLSFCACVVDDEDIVERGLSGTHAAIIAEVTRRVERLLAGSASNVAES